MSARSEPSLELIEAVLAWGGDELRDLGWRRTRDPWAILVAETMLQQTQVSRVEPRWNAFLELMPTPTACASAGAAEVIRLWDGLGYNRRAVNLHRCAEAIVTDHGGQVPDSLDALLRLPGVGPYTARAVLAFAFEDDQHGVLDTNVGRVLARAAAGRALAPREAQALADDLVPVGHGWLWNQSIMEIGAQFCRKRGPSCDTCPVRDCCSWQRACHDGTVDDPAEGSAGVSKPQSSFDGSDRQGRGRLVAALRAGEVARNDLADVTGWPDQPERADRIAADLVSDGLAIEVDGTLRLPV